MIGLGIGLIITLTIQIIICTYFAKTVEKAYDKEQETRHKKNPSKTKFSKDS